MMVIDELKVNELLYQLMLGHMTMTSVSTQLHELMSKSYHDGYSDGMLDACGIGCCSGGEENYGDGN